MKSFQANNNTQVTPLPFPSLNHQINIIFCKSVGRRENPGWILEDPLNLAASTFLLNVFMISKINLNRVNRQKPIFFFF